MSSRILATVDKILPPKFDTLRGAMRRRQQPRDILNRKMKQTGLNPPSIEKRASEKGTKVSESTVKAILRGEATNAGFFTWEAIALGMDLPPLQVFAELIGEDSTDPQLSGGQFGVLEELYKELTGAKRSKADIYIEGLQLLLRQLRDQPK